ncbi:MAG TPA: peptidase M23 [Gammaproteobacteria bacterium]|nr:peptidase M23 [Gammaproteobacteria bacterium]
MIRKRPSPFGKDLRHRSRRSVAGKSRVLARPSHWMATLVIAVAIGIWLGSSPDAAVERPSPTLKKQIELVLEQDPAPVSESRIGTGVNPLPSTESFQGVAALKKPVPSLELSATPVSANKDGQAQKDKKNSEQEFQSIPHGAGLSKTKNLTSPIDLSTASRTDNGADDSQTISLQKTRAPAVSPQTIPWESIQIRSGDSLVGIFKRLNLNVAEAIRISKLPQATPLISLRTGPYLKIQRDGEALLTLQYQPNTRTILRIEAQEVGFVAKIVERTFESTQREITAEITDSLYRSARRAGIPEPVIYRIARIFQWELDFGRDIKPGDMLTVIYEERSLDGQKVGNGPILAARLENDGIIRQAIRYVNADGDAAYYTPDGKSLQRAFLRSPVAGRQVTSGFSYNRLHPILKVRRPHLGVDYGAPRGTPIVATADGKVIRASRKGGYGKTIILRHGQDYRTLYAHLSRYAKGVRKGKWVKKGQIIGYVGSTGLSTGPHLHYEIHVAGKARNPESFRLPRAASVGRKEKAGYLEHAKVWVSRLDQAHRRA